MSRLFARCKGARCARPAGSWQKPEFRGRSKQRDVGTAAAC